MFGWVSIIIINSLRWQVGSGRKLRAAFWLEFHSRGLPGLGRKQFCTPEEVQPGG